MLRIPNALFTEYAAHLNKRKVPQAYFAEYKKWLRYYLDFCHKYPVPLRRSERVRLFCDKLKERNQWEEQRERAARAVSLYFEMQKAAVSIPTKGTAGETPASGQEAHALEGGHCWGWGKRWHRSHNVRAERTAIGA